MSLNPDQFRRLIEQVLHDTDPALADPVAVRLLLGTAAVESQFGTYLRQVHGPALGVFQMEPATFDWLQVKYGLQYPIIADREASELEWDLRLAIIMARLRYRAVPKPLPADNVTALADYWKEHYNTKLGAGTVEQFMDRFTRYVHFS